jgi:hypothetical protein
MSLGRLLALHGALGANNPSDRAARARTLLGFLIRRADAPRESDKAALAAELAAIAEEQDGALFHDHMEQNRAFHVDDVIGRAAKAGLVYFADAQWWTGILDNAPGGAGPELAEVSDRAMRELYLDFLLMRRYRASLFHRAGNTASDETLAPDRLLSLAVSAPFMEEDTSAATPRFVKRSGQSVQSSDVLPINLLRCLTEAKGACLPVPTCIEQVALRMNVEPASIRGPCLQVLRSLAIGNLVELTKTTRQWVGVPGHYPAADPLVLRELEEPNRSWVTSLRHIPVQLAPERISLLRQLTGNRSRENLSAMLSEDPAQGAAQLNAQLAWLAEMALLTC